MLQEVTPRVIWQGNGSASSIQLQNDGIPISFADDAYIAVKQLDDDGVETTLVAGADYEISLSQVLPGAVSPATLTRKVAGVTTALPSGYFWVAERTTPAETDIDIGGDFSDSDIEAMGDRIMEVVQELKDKVDRSFKASAFDEAPAGGYVLPSMADQAGKRVIVNDDEDGFDFSEGDGWSPEFAVVSNGEARALKVVDWTGGTGTKPDIDVYVGATGFVADIGDAVDVRGPAGADGEGIGDLLAANNLSDVANAATAFGNIKQAATDAATGVVEEATDAEVRAATNGKFLDAGHIESASAAVALTDAATVAVDWDAGINFTLTLTANRVLGNPTNGQPGTWRTVRVRGDDTTNRTLTFDSQYGGTPPSLTDIDDTQWYLLMIFCVTTTHFVVSAVDASAP